MSAPHSSGRISYGVATVLSTISGTPFSWATPGDALDVEHVVPRVADRLAVERLGVGPHRGPPRVEVVGVVDERGLDARAWAACSGAGCRCRRRAPPTTTMWLPGLGQVEDGQRLGRLAGRPRRARRGCRRPCRCAPSRRGDAGLEHALGRVHDPGVDVADLGQREQVGGVVGVPELVRRSSGRSARPGRRWSGRAPGRRGSDGSRNPSRWQASCAPHVRRRPVRPDSRPDRCGVRRRAAISGSKS